MRPIKFRAWVRFDSGKYGMLDHENLLDWSLREVLEDEGTDVLMQFTGLLDKNGKEIYEGDVVKLLHSAEDYAGMLGSIEWCDSGCCGGWRVQFIGVGNNEMFAKYAENSEIIGNIYENTSLLLISK